MTEVIENQATEEVIVENEVAEEAVVENVDAGSLLGDVVEETVEIKEEIIAEEVKETVTEQTFLDMIGDDYKEVKALQSFKSVDDLAKSYLHLNSMLGKKMDELKQEDISSYYDKLGRPEEAGSYKFADEVAGEGADWAKNTFHEVGLTQDQAKHITDKYHELETSKAAALEEANNTKISENIETLKAEFGEAFDERITLAKRAVNEFGGEDLKTMLNETGLGNDARIVKMFAQIGKDMLEDSVIAADKAVKFGTTPQEAQSEINILKKDSDFMDKYLAKNGHSKNSAPHREAVSKMQELFEKAYK